MKKLGKKSHELIETIEAYADACDGVAICQYCSCSVCYSVPSASASVTGQVSTQVVSGTYAGVRAVMS